MSLSSRAPAAAQANGSKSSMADALASWNVSHLGNQIISNSLIAGAAQYANIDDYFAASPGENPAMSAIKEGLWISAISQTGGMLRNWWPQLRVF